MKLTLSRETLLAPLQMVSNVIENKQTLPILANVLINIQENILTIMSTDLGIELIGVATLPLPIATPVKITVPGRKLLEVCRTLPENALIEFIIEENSNKMILRSGRSRYTFTTLPAEDFPYIEQYEPTATVTVSQKDLRSLLQRTHFAMAQQDVRYFLNGILLELLPNCLNAVATDGHRLAFSSVETELSLPQPTRIIIPRKSVLELMRLLENSDEKMVLEVSSSNLSAKVQNYTFTSKLLEGRFPDYQQAIPRGAGNKIILNRETFKQTLNRSAILSNASYEKARAVNFELKPNLLRILANNALNESAEEEIEIDYSHEEFNICMNVNYLLDVMSTLDSEEIVLTVSGFGSGVLIEEMNNKNSIFVVMPMQL